MRSSRQCGLHREQLLRAERRWRSVRACPVSDHLGARPVPGCALVDGRARWRSVPDGSADARANESDGEGPVHEVEVSGFLIDTLAVDNTRFAEFVDATGYELEPDGRHLMNVFQGTSPGGNTCADGFAGTAPVDAYPPNALGLYNVTGNVWEWCADWFDVGTYRRSPRQDPIGPAIGTLRVMHGGSYLCHEPYCRRYRIAARSANTPDSSTGNLGFRVASNIT